MRILLVHSEYSHSQPSGENTQVAATAAALARHGHVVSVARRETDTLSKSPLYPLVSGLTVATGLGASPIPEVLAFRPDVIHVHNLFPNYGTRWLSKFHHTPVVVTSHNYRWMCASATLWRDGRLCADCIGRTAVLSPALRHGCYRGSRAATLPLAIGMPRARRLISESANAVVALSEVHRDWLLAAGLPKHKVHILPNFVPMETVDGAGQGGDGWVFAGRLDEQKGILDVISAWPNEISLKVMGDGPLAQEARRAAHGKNVEFLGQTTRLDVMRTLRSSRGLVFASRWPETFGLVYAEALAAGTPVLATRPSAAADLVQQDGAGMAVDRITSDAVRDAHQAFGGLRDVARRAYEGRYTESAHVRGLERVYAAVTKRDAMRSSEGWTSEEPTQE